MIDSDESCCNHPWKFSYTVTVGAIIYGNSRDFENFQTRSETENCSVSDYWCGEPLISLILAAGKIDKQVVNQNKSNYLHFPRESNEVSNYLNNQSFEGQLIKIRINPIISIFRGRDNEVSDYLNNQSFDGQLIKIRINPIISIFRGRITKHQII